MFPESLSQPGLTSPCLLCSLSTAGSLPSDFFDSSTKPAVVYSDSESEEEEHGNGDTPLPLQEEVDHPPKDALNSEKPSHQLPEKTEDQEGCVCAVLCHMFYLVTVSAMSVMYLFCLQPVTLSTLTLTASLTSTATLPCVQLPRNVSVGLKGDLRMAHCLRASLTTQ